MWKRRIEQATVLTLVIVVCLLLSLAAVSGLFVYWRDGILHGEYWRLVTGNFVHLNWQHASLNLVAWFLVWVYGARVCGLATWLVSLLLCASGVGIGLLLLLPEIELYSGLSGVLHGLLVVVAGLRLLAWRRDYSAWAILVAVLAKLVFEGVWGSAGATVDWIGMMVVSEAHLYGALSGALLFIVVALARAVIARVRIFPRA